MTIHQIFLGSGGIAKKTYIDDVFSNYVYEGTGSNQTITNNLDLATEGGMVWIKNRSDARNYVMGDSVRGDNKYVVSASSNGQGTNDSRFRTLKTTGFEVGSDNDAGVNGDEYGSWSFLKSKGFFDVLSYTGSGSTQTISHSLGCIPSCIMVKRTDANADWGVYHRGQNKGVTPWSYRIKLNSDGAESDDNYFGDVAPTSNQFTIGGSDAVVNASGGTYIAYLFAGGESTAATARSVDFDGNDYMSVGSSSDYSFGTGDFTVECWVKRNSTNSNVGFFQIGNTSDGLQQSGYGDTVMASHNGTQWRIYGAGSDPAYTETMHEGQWYHIAYVRASGVSTLYVNGIKKISQNDTTDYDGTTVAIGSYYSTSQTITANISNFRIVKGTAVYTSSFRPPTKPLTNITNTKLLCLNNSSVTGSTVAAGSFSVNSTDPTASIDSPFDDPSGFKFGENKNQNIIKSGSYVGNGSSTGPEIFLGWEPQWVLIKCASASGNWHIYDSIRGIRQEGDDALFRPNNGDAEETNVNAIDLTSRGFKIQTSYSHWNANGESFFYTAIRRPDGYVGKTPAAGTDVFDVDYGSSSFPRFDTNFPVDMATWRQPNTSEHWYTSARVLGPESLYYSKTDGEFTNSNSHFDSNVGWHNSATSSYQSWMWKRGLSFDTVTYKGNGVAGRQLAHSLNKTPEMIWVKRRNGSSDWMMYHKDLNGGTNPHNWFLKLNTNTTQSENSNRFGGAPDSLQFTVGTDSDTNANNDLYIAHLFCSIDGISKIGTYAGSDSSQEISLGFEPRFFIWKNIDTTNWWVMTDFKLGIATSAGNSTGVMYFGKDNAGDSDSNLHKTATSMVLAGNVGGNNDAGSDYIYYAHA